MKTRLKALIPAICAGCLWGSSVQAADDEIYLGSVAMDVPAAMVQRLTPLTTYLSKKTGLKVSFRASPNLGSAVNELGKDVTQIAYLTPVAYIEAQEKYKAKPLVSPLTHGKSTFNLVVVVQQDSNIQNMMDLVGKSFALGDEKALLQRAVVVNGGIGLHQFSRFGFLKHYDNIAKAVLNKDFDAGILKNSSYEKYAAQGLRKIHTSPPLSSYLFAINEKVPTETANKLRAAFLALKIDNAESKDVIKALDPAYDGFVSVEDKDYDEVRKLIAPFQKRAK